MAYADDEESQAASAPIEAYEFVGSATTWRYTSAAEAVTIDGDVYTPLAGLRRGGFGIATIKDTPSLTVTLPSFAPIVQDYVFAIAPRTLLVSAYRYQPVSGEWIRFWRGDVRSITPTGKTAQVTSPSFLATQLSTNVPGLTVRAHCAHFFGDPRCRVDRELFKHLTTVATVSGTDARIVTVAGVGIHPNQRFRAGEIVRDADGERRTIVDQVGAVLKLVSPFRTLANGNAVTMYFGCAHTPTDCEDTYNNLINFGGFHRMPKRDPFKVSITLGED